MTELFSDGFESGDYSEWTDEFNNGTHNIDSTTVHSGTYSDYCKATAAWQNWSGGVYKDIGDQSLVYARNYVYFAKLPDSGQYYDFNGLYDGWSYLARIRVRNNGGTLQIGLYIGGSETLTNYALVEDTWYRIEIGRFKDASGWTKLWVDGAEEESPTVTVNGDTSGNFVDRVMFGIVYSGSEADAELYQDDCIIADAYIGEEGLSQTVTETLTIADSLSKKFTKSLFDSFSIGEVSPKNFIKITTETISVSDSLTKKLTKKLSDAITVVTSETGQLLGALSQTVTETITIVDHTAKNFVKKISESLTASDSQVKNFTKSLTEAISISDVTKHTLTKILSDAISIADSHIKKLTKKLTEALEITASTSQTLTTAFNGVVISLKFLKRKIKQVFG